jgi:hypothetical protein
VNNELGDKNVVLFTEGLHEKKNYGSYSTYAVDAFLKNIATN